MASNTKAVGSGGEIQIIVDLVTQSVSNNRSVVRVRGIMHNNSGRSYDSSGVSVSISGTNSWSSTRTFDIASNGSFTIVDQDFTVNHGTDGRKSVSYTFKLGSTLTGTFGSGGSVTVGMTLPRIDTGGGGSTATIPGKVARPTLQHVSGTTFNVSWPTPNNGGSGILEYRIRVDDSASFPSPVFTETTSISQNITNATMGKRWHVCVQARNAIGWGPWSDNVSILIPTVPEKGGVPTLEYSPPSTVTMSWATPDNGGSGILSYDYQYDDNSSYSSPVAVNTKSISNVIRNLLPGKKYWFRYRARNIQGAGHWSNSAAIDIASGPAVKMDGVWRNSMVYVRFNGEWRIAIPYVRQNGSWKMAGS